MSLIFRNRGVVITKKCPRAALVQVHDADADAN
jgi:hypothetical protein